MSAEEVDIEDDVFLPFIETLPTLTEDFYTGIHPNAYYGTDWTMIPEISIEPLFDFQKPFLKNNLIQSVQFIKRLGLGSFATVWEVTAEHRLSEQHSWGVKKFACKVIRAHQGVASEVGVPMAVQQSFNDMRALRRLRHRNICNMEAFIGIPDRKTSFTHSTLCVFMELCDGSLQELMDEGRVQAENNRTNWPLPENITKQWMRQIMVGMEYFHKRGVVHYDITARNILYQFRGACSPEDPLETILVKFRIKISDFGMSHTRETIGQVNFRNLYLRDRNQLFFILVDYGVDSRLWHEKDYFLDYCKTRQMNPKYPEHWTRLSNELLDFAIALNSDTLKNLQLLAHPWFKISAETTPPLVIKLPPSVDPLPPEPEPEPLSMNQLYFLNDELEKERLIKVQVFVDAMGLGEFGCVWQVATLYHETKKILALKIIRNQEHIFKSRSGRAAVEPSFMSTLQNLQHLNICKVDAIIGIPQKEGLPQSIVCILMELCDGNLRQLMEEGLNIANKTGANWPLPKYTKHWFRQILEGMVYIHSNGIIHGNIKDTNVLYLCEGVSKKDSFEKRILNSTFKLSDYGLTEIYESAGDQANFDRNAFSDRSGLYHLLLKHGIYCVEEEPLFSEYCKSRKWRNVYPRHWRNFSHHFLDFARAITLESVAESDLLGFPWLQTEGIQLGASPQIKNVSGTGQHPPGVKKGRKRSKKSRRRV